METSPLAAINMVHRMTCIFTCLFPNLIMPPIEKCSSVTICRKIKTTIYYPTIIIIIIIIMHISPLKLIQEPQMRSCSSHLSNKNVLRSFRNESKLNDGSFILAGRSFQIVGPQTLNDLGPTIILSFIRGSWG